MNKQELMHDIETLEKHIDTLPEGENRAQAIEMLRVKREALEAIIAGRIANAYFFEPGHASSGYIPGDNNLGSGFVFRPDVLGLIGGFLSQWPDAEYGPAHVVLSDYNLEDEWLDTCETKLEAALQGVEADPAHSTAELQATLAFLRALRAIPEDDRVLDRD